jgi:hypothetical protein
VTTYRSAEVQPIRLQIVGGRIDLLTLGVVQISLQRIADKVAHDLLGMEGVLSPDGASSVQAPRWFPPDYPRVVQLEMVQARTGSFDASVGIAIASVLADPHVLAVLDNLAANVLWAIGATALRGIRRELRENLPIPAKIHRQDQDPYRVEPFLRDMILIAEQNPNVKAIRLSLPNAGTCELDIEFYRRQGR